MKDKEIREYAKLLVAITIKKHREKLLGKEKMSKFIKDNLTQNVKDIDYNRILHQYNKYLAQAGYEIWKDIIKFDIIDYNSDEYQLYVKEIKNNNL